MKIELQDIFNAQKQLNILKNYLKELNVTG